MLHLRSALKVVSYQLKNSREIVTSSCSNMKLADVVQTMENFAPLTFAEKWDNVGLLIEPSQEEIIKKIILTNDLTEVVLKEAKEKNANLIVSYHPPIFSGLKRLTKQTWKERIILECIERKIAIYSPHTSWDSCPQGVNDWLAGCLPIASKEPAITNAINPLYGAGRICSLSGEITLREAIVRIKRNTGLLHVHVAIASNGSLHSPINSFGVCAGSGASVLKEIKAPIDLFITGELSHHDCLEAVHRQIHVVTLNHSNSERGYLKEFKNILEGLLENDQVEIIVSQEDVDPLNTF